MSAREPATGPAAVILISGGLDSAVTALCASSLGYCVHGLTFAYGQRHALELRFAQELARCLELASHGVVEITGLGGGSSALTDRTIDVPTCRSDEEIEGGSIPVTYVPARNTIFLSCALARCEELGCGDIFIGVNALDYSGYPDCRPEYLAAFEKLAMLATRAGVEHGQPIRVRAPVLHRSKADIIRLGAEFGLDFGKTWSCYDPVQFATDGEETFAACGRCDSCILRRRGFREAGIVDPTPYADC